MQKIVRSLQFSDDPSSFISESESPWGESISGHDLWYTSPERIDNLRISHNASGMGANIRVLVT